MVDNSSLTLVGATMPSTLGIDRLKSSRFVPLDAPYPRPYYTDILIFWQRYEVFRDPYHGVPRLNLFKFDGSPMHPMYLAYRPPQMLPTQTMNPTTTATGAPQATQTGKKAKRGLEAMSLPLNKHALRKRKEPIDLDRWWWIGAAMTALGAVGYLCF